MSSLPFIQLEDSPSAPDVKMLSSIYTGTPQFVNPRHTDKWHNDFHFGDSYSDSGTPNGLPTPGASTPVSSSHRPLSLALTDASRCYVSGPSSASSMGSFSGFLTPPSSISTSSSRRESVAFPEGQHYFIAGSPSPRPRGLKSHAHREHYSLPGSFCSNPDALSSESSSFSSIGEVHPCMPEHDILMAAEADQHRSHMEWQYMNTVNDFEHSMQVHMPQNFNRDSSSSFGSQLSHHTMDMSPSYGGNPMVEMFQDRSPVPQIVVPSQTHLQSTSVSPVLAEPFESPKLKRSVPLKSLKERRGIRKTKHKAPPSFQRVQAKDFEFILRAHDERRQAHLCPHCKPVIDTKTGKWAKVPSFQRPEHLKRHMMSLHAGAERVDLPCIFPHCGKSITGGRSDNMTQHLRKTHFCYGKTEKGGKNRRISMKESEEMGFRLQDPRWTELLDGAIEFGDTKNWYWKMLGYSIKETEELKIKDIVPEWDGPEDMTLKEVDPRWKKLLDGSMSFAQAMERGWRMKETESEGLLGVGMLVTEEMGLRHLDPRWTELLSGCMSIEMSEKLGVKQYNPEWTALQTKRR